MWKKINHGGEPTKNIDKKYAIFVGRYQPYHFGHIELIKQKLNQGNPKDKKQNQTYVIVLHELTWELLNRLNILS